jgi:hypothetical protein
VVTPTDRQAKPSALHSTSHTRTPGGAGP